MAENTDFDQEIEALAEYPNRWPARRRLVERMVDAGQGTRAAEVVWGAPTIPQEPAEIAWALSILSKHMTRRAVRLTHALVEKYTQKPHILARLADCLEREGCGLQAARIYGAAQLVDSAITDAEFESGLMALDAAGTASAGIAGKGEVVGVLNWVPGGGKGLEAEDPVPEITATDADAQPAEPEAADSSPEKPASSAPSPAKPSAPPSVAPKAGAPPTPPSPPSKSAGAPPVKKLSAPSPAPAKAPTPAADSAPAPAKPAAAQAPTPVAPKPAAPAPTPAAPKPAAAAAPAPAASPSAPKPAAAAKAPVALKKPVGDGAPKSLGAAKTPGGPVGPPKIAKVPGKGD